MSSGLATVPWPLCLRLFSLSPMLSCLMYMMVLSIKGALGIVDIVFINGELLP